MQTLIRCHCGFEARAEHEDELVAEVQRHAAEAHGMALSQDEALLLVFRAELDSDETAADLRRRSRSGSSDHIVSHAKEER